MSVLEKKRIEKVRALAKQNGTCCNCTSILPNNVVMQFGTFVCPLCASAHRQLNHSGVRTISSSSFSKEDVEFLAQRGNAHAHNILGIKSDDKKSRSYFHNDREFVEAIRKFIRSVYKEKKFDISSTDSKHSSSTRDRRISFNAGDKGSKLVSRRRTRSNASMHNDKQPAKNSTQDQKEDNLLDDVLSSEQSGSQQPQHQAQNQYQNQQINSSQPQQQSQASRNPRKDFLSNLDNMFDNAQQYSQSNNFQPSNAQGNMYGMQYGNQYSGGMQNGNQFNPQNNQFMQNNAFGGPQSFQGNQFQSNQQFNSTFSNPAASQQRSNPQNNRNQVGMQHGNQFSGGMVNGNQAASQSQNNQSGQGNQNFGNQQWSNTQQYQHSAPSHSMNNGNQFASSQNKSYAPSGGSNPFDGPNPFESPQPKSKPQNDQFGDLVGSMSSMAIQKTQNPASKVPSSRKNGTTNTSSHGKPASHSAGGNPFDSPTKSGLNQNDPFGFDDFSPSKTNAQPSNSQNEKIQQRSISNSDADAFRFEDRWKNTNVSSSDQVKEGNDGFSLQPEASFKQNVGWRNQA